MPIYILLYIPIYITLTKLTPARIIWSSLATNPICVARPQATQTLKG